MALCGCGKPVEKEASKEEVPTTPVEDPRAIRVGVFLPLTGAKAAFGDATLRGAKLAVEQLNAAGGVLERPLLLVVKDSRSDAEGAVAAVRELAAEKAVALIGEVTSVSSLAAAPVAVELGLPMISPGATHPDVTKAGPWVFRIGYVDPFPAVVMSKFATSIGATRAAVMYDPSNPYSLVLEENFVANFTAAQGTIVARESYAAAQPDFTPQLEAVKKSAPEVIFLPGYFAEAAKIIKQARAMGLDMPFLGTDGWESDEFLQAGGKDVANTYFASHFSAEEKSERTVKFVADYEKLYGRAPIALGALGYDAVNFVADALRRAGGTEAIALRDALAATKDFPGVTGNITLDENRNPAKSAIVLRVADGKFTYLETVAP